MIAANHYNPIVGFAQSWGVAVEHLLIIPRLLESETAVSGNDEQRVRQLVLDAQLVYQGIEFSVDVSAYNNVLGFGECVCLECIHVVNDSDCSNKVEDALGDIRQHPRTECFAWRLSFS